MNEELAETLKYLRLGGLLSHWDDYLRLGAAKRLSHAQWLTHILQEEYRIKQSNARQKRLKQARIPEMFAIETYPFERQPKLNKKMIMAMYDSLEYMEKNLGIIFLTPHGPPFADLVAELYRSVGDHSEDKVLQRYLSYDCLLIDEIGYVEVEPVQVGLFFTLMQMRHKKRSTIITSNLGFGDWKSFLKNDHLTAALIDRLTETCHVVNMRNCVGLRPRLSMDA